MRECDSRPLKIMSSASFSDTREINSARADFVNDFTKLVEEKVRDETRQSTAHDTREFNSARADFVKHFTKLVGRDGTGAR